MKKKTLEFRQLITGQGLVLRPCAYDALSAVLIEKAGFRVIGTTGYGIAASLIGQPDIGLVGYAEMLERARTIVNAVNRPVEIDADTGYGDAMNVYWTVQNLARVGVAGIRIEDQEWPKRCGHMAGKSVITIEDMLTKIRAALQARDAEDPDIIIGARTDIRSLATFEETIQRAVAYAEAGADYVYVEAPQSLEEVAQLVKLVPKPLAFNIIPGGKTPLFKMEDLEDCGVRYLSIPMVCLYPAAKAMASALNMLKNGCDLEKIATLGTGWSEFNELIGMDRWQKREMETSPGESIKRKYGSTNLNANK